VCGRSGDQIPDLPNLIQRCKRFATALTFTQVPELLCCLGATTRRMDTANSLMRQHNTASMMKAFSLLSSVICKNVLSFRAFAPTFYFYSAVFCGGAKLLSPSAITLPMKLLTLVFTCWLVVTLGMGQARSQPASLGRAKQQLGEWLPIKVPNVLIKRLYIKLPPKVRSLGESPQLPEVWSRNPHARLFMIFVVVFFHSNSAFLAILKLKFLF